MADEDSAEKPFEATPRKIEEARKRGEVPVSQDLITFAVYLGILVTLPLIGLWSIERAGSALLPLFDSPEVLAPALFSTEGRHAYGALIFTFAATAIVWFALPFVLALVMAFLQGALLFAPSKLKPKLNRISPIQNAKQKYGWDGLFNFFKSFLKLVIYSLVLGLVFNARLGDILSMPSLPVASSITMMAELCFRFLATVSIVIFAIAIIDLFWQRAQFFRRQRMSLKELRDETKETEGDPYTRQARRQKAYDIATNQMLSEIPDADVVVVNPEHFAVALKWVRTNGTAPVCIGKGVDEIAARIRETAIENGVPIYRDPPTARALHAAIEIGEEIPVEHYRAIAAAIRFADAIRQKAKYGEQ